jgi:SAM-dependent methyltransferase
MKVEDLPIVGLISNTDKDFFGKFSQLFNKKILLIGFSEEEAIDLVEKYHPKEITMLTKWADHKDAEVSRYKLTIGDICKKTSFDENQFDSVLTLSVLEHLDNLSGAVNEMSRICVPGGEMLHMFGPAWSCAYGHHIYAKADDPLLNFSLWQMPAHLHLLCSKDEIYDYYCNARDEESARAVLHWFYDTPIINRLFYQDYLSFFEDGGLIVDSIVNMNNLLPVNHLLHLRNKFPNYKNFSTYGSKIKLINSK